MDTITTGFYFIKDEFFKLTNTKLEFVDFKNNRHMYFVIFYNHELWAIPLSSQYEKYKKWYEEAKQMNKKNRFLIFVNVLHKDGVLLVQNAFPISPAFIERPVIDLTTDTILSLQTELIEFVVKRLKRMIIFEEKGILKFHVDLKSIRTIIYNHKNNDKR